MRRLWLVLGSIVLLTACGTPSETDIQAAVAQTQAVWTPIPTQTPYPTQTAAATVAVRVTVQVTVVKVVTVTPTATPKMTPTITSTPTETAEPSPTPDPLYSPKRDGFYLIGVDMGPGRWRSTSTNDSCYWARLDVNDEILDNHFGGGGGAVNIRASDYQFRSERCGPWEYLGP